MKSKLIASLFVLFTAAASPAIAREPVAIINHENLSIMTASGQALSKDRVRQAIMNAASNKQWSISGQGEGKMTAILNVRGKHTVLVDIFYTPTTYSIIYRDSSNMKYTVQDGVPMIHPFYNRWVNDLRDSIRLELNKL